MCRGNVNNQKEAFNYLQIFITHISMGLGSEEYQMEILNNNEDLLMQLHFKNMSISESELGDEIDSSPVKKLRKTQQIGGVTSVLD